MTRIAAAIYCEREGQKAILIGKGGAKLKEIGAAARKQIESLLGTRVYLELHVIVEANWRESRALSSRWTGGGSLRTLQRSRERRVAHLSADSNRYSMRARPRDTHIVSAARAIDMNLRGAAPRNLQRMRVAHRAPRFRRAARDCPHAADRHLWSASRDCRNRAPSCVWSTA